MNNRKSDQRSFRRKAVWPGETDNSEKMRSRNNKLGLAVLIIMIVLYFDIGGCATTLGRYFVTGISH